MILSYLPAKSLLNVSECNRRLRDLCQDCNSLWKHLCKVRQRRNHTCCFLDLPANTIFYPLSFESQ